MKDSFDIVKSSVYEYKDPKRKEKWEEFVKKVVKKSSTEIKIDEKEVISALLEKKVNNLVSKILEDNRGRSSHRKGDQDDSDDERELNRENWDMKVLPEIQNKIVDENQNIYLKFLRSREKKAAVWRPEEVCSSDKINELSLSLRGEIVTNMIAKDFCDWLRNLGGLEETTMDEEILKELFQIGLENPAADSICVEMRERPAVSCHIAEAIELPKKAFHAGLQRQLLWDIEAEESKKQHCAFGTRLNAMERWQPPKNQTCKKWIECGTVPEHLVTFSFVFEGITDLKSVKEYYNWLTKNPQYKIPDYLQHRKHILTDGQNIDDTLTSHSDLSKLNFE